jgi:hypothetical protein
MLKLDCQLDFKKKKLTRKIVFFRPITFSRLGKSCSEILSDCQKGSLGPFSLEKLLEKKRLLDSYRFFCQKVFVSKKTKKAFLCD